MSETTPAKRSVLVIGHKNPDTDSICSALAYAELKNQTGEREYLPGRAGEINQETAYVLRRFHLQPPALFENVSPQVRDIDIRRVSGIDGGMTMHDALVRMRDRQVSTLPVVAEGNRLVGLISMKDLALGNMASLSRTVLGEARTPFGNILRTLQGTLLCGDADGVMASGRVVVGAGSPDIIESAVRAGDLVILSNRYESQLCAIELDAACIIVCNGAEVARTIVRLAGEHHTTVIRTPLDTYEAACMIGQSVPVAHYMVRENLMCFHLDDSVEEASAVMGRVRHVYFPVLDRDGSYCGMISRRNLLNLQRKELILVDHNEKNQCVDGFEEANILEIIDHHRIGSMETVSPVFFRNQPVGCTATIVLQMYREQGVTPKPEIAGALCAAILSDTLLFRSPTCTDADRRAVEELAPLAGVEPAALAADMFEAGENLDGKKAEDLFQQDYKRFDSNGVSFGVGQGSFVSEKNLERARGIIAPYLHEALRHQSAEMVFFLLTNVLEEYSEVLWAGDGARELLSRAFSAREEDGRILLSGVVSRKKQFIPSLLRALQEE
jgi:manganese-dependent inorganic pyrophosphatase